MNWTRLGAKAANNTRSRLWYNLSRCLLFLRDRG